MLPREDLAIERYRRLAAGYDRATRRMEVARRHAIEALRLRPGDQVLDVACGTGKSFPLIEERVGHAGRIVGVDLSPDMLAQARKRVDQGGWTNVTLVESSMRDAPIPDRFDAVLFVYTHDVLQTPDAVAHIFRHVRDGARISSTGTRCPPWWMFPLGLWVLLGSRRYFTTRSGLSRPWRLLERHVPNLQVCSTFLGTGYLAQGVYSVCAEPRFPEGGPDFGGNEKTDGDEEPFPAQPPVEDVR